ncbi:hypothetical protein [Bosea sp. Tri-44]|nr:hypothetical protein [Bosea sp. Tri-44]
MSEFDDLRCPFRAEVLAAVPVWQMMLIHGAGTLALLMLLR